MKESTVLSTAETKRYWRFALILAFFTIIYNILEGLLSTWFGYEEHTLTLFGFGVDSFIETISGIGIAHMVVRIMQHPDEERDDFETTALRITGTAFYILAIGLASSAIFNLYVGKKPMSTIPGIIISVISIIVMILLVYAKEKVGKTLHSEPILADAGCTRTCVYMSVVLLASSVIYSLTGLAYIDFIGSMGIVWFAYTEGKECFEKANNKKMGCACNSKKG